MSPDVPWSPLYKAFIFSTDDFFTSVGKDGMAEYCFEPELLSRHHKKNQFRCEIAMGVGITPIFVDNTNTALWEMRAYLSLADQYGYTVCIIDPLSLFDGALDADALMFRCLQDDGARPPGKLISHDAINRMVRRFEDLPQGSVEDGLDAIRMSTAPFERQQKQPRLPRPRYAGLDVEAKALAALGSIDLGPYFWEGNDTENSPAGSHLFDARYMEQSRWYVPDRLHVTVRHYGSREDRVNISDAEDLVGTWHAVTARALVLVRGGGLLCAACDLCGDGAKDLQALAGDDWYPHITLLTAGGWRPADSTAVLKAWQAACEERKQNNSKPEARLASESFTQLNSVCETIEGESSYVETTQPDSALVGADKDTLQEETKQHVEGDTLEAETIPWGGEDALRAGTMHGVEATTSDAQATRQAEADTLEVETTCGMETDTLGAEAMHHVGADTCLAETTQHDSALLRGDTLEETLPDSLESHTNVDTGTSLGPTVEPAQTPAWTSGKIDVFHNVCVQGTNVDICVLHIHKELGKCKFQVFS